MSAASQDANEPPPPPPDVDSIGREFARVYFDAFAARTDAPALESLHGDRSKYVFLRPGRLADHAVKGARAIGRFVERAHRGPAGCAVRVDSVDAMQVRPGRLAVLTVGKLTRREGSAERTFVQSTVVACAAASSVERRFSVVGTVFKFDDDVVDDIPEDDGPDEDVPEEDVPEVNDVPKEDVSETPAESERSGRDDANTPPPPTIVEGVPGDAAVGGERTTGPAGHPAPATAIKLYVGGLSQTVTADDLAASFGRFGPVADVSVRQCANNKKKSVAGPPRYFGIVRFENPETTDAVAGRGTVTLANGDRVTVEISIRRQTRGKAD